MPQEHPFPVEIRTVAGARRRVQVVHCATHDCRTEFVLNVNTPTAGGMSPETIVRKAGLKGWQARRSGREMTCPGCGRTDRALVIARKVSTARGREQVEAFLDGVPEDKRQAAYDAVRLEAVLSMGAPSLQDLERRMEEAGANDVVDKIEFEPPPRKEPPMPATAAAPRADPPPTVSRDDKRRINDAVSAHWLSEEVGYASDWSDAKIAASLSVPEAWVRDLRVDLFGDNGGNEEGSAVERARRKALNECKRDLSTAEGKLKDAFARVAEAETSIASVRTRLEKLEAGQ